MQWKGRELKTVGDLAWAIEHCATQEEAQQFMAAYRSLTPHADSNVGYVNGYFANDAADRIRTWFGVEHPIFGATHPSAREVLLAGMAVGGGADPRDVRALFGGTASTDATGSSDGRTP